ncbi:MAG TPA: DNA (cytosine-5-)-methyltransferase [Gemmataceae bacterium]|nr:DNA (cytosine-5-)-methyltransferase [Gemmataceae bacterium]
MAERVPEHRRRRGRASPRPLACAGLFAGIGGIEHGLHRAGHRPVLLCEIEEHARAVLGERFAGCRLEADVRELQGLPEADLVAAGFPCQDLSQAGGKEGIGGRKSGVVDALFGLLRRNERKPPRWLLIENVPYMLSLERGRAMAVLTRRLDELGFAWAYRVVDCRSFGIPQRRPRVILLASPTEDPRAVLFPDEHGVCPVDDCLYEVDADLWYGFYWTEGKRGVGWAASSVPPIKGGSGLGIPSPPAVWIPKRGFLGTIDIRDAERLQGFPAGWTQVAATGQRRGENVRWRLVGNAVCAVVAEWVGKRLRRPKDARLGATALRVMNRWPKAAWGARGEAFEVDRSMWPVKKPYRHLEDFLEFPLKPLSLRATQGYQNRARQCPYRLSREFLDGVAQHLQRMRKDDLGSAARR